MAKLTLADVTAGYLSATTYNANNALIEAALENTLSRDGTSPNTMTANLDLNSNKVVNLADGTNNQDACTVAQLNNAVLGTPVVTASTVNSETATDGYVLTADGAGNSAWEVIPTSGLSNIVEDTTPQLGGALDLNGQNITAAGPTTISPTEMSYLDGVTSNIQTQLNAKGTVSTLADLSVSSTAAELNFLDASLKEYTNGLMLTGDGGTSLQWRAIVEADISDLGAYLTSVAVTDLNNGTDGELITWDAAGAPTTVAAGTAGQVLTSNGAGAAPTFQSIAVGETKYKTADESITSDTTLSADTHLTGYTLVANSYYKIEGFFRVSAASATPDIKFRPSFTQTPQDCWWSMSLVDTAGNVVDDASQYSGDVVLNMTTTNQYMGWVRGHIQTNASTGGTFTVTWAQNTLSVDALVFEQGSWLTLTQIS